MAEAYIVEALRTPGGRRKGALSGCHPADLGADILNALVSRTGIDPNAIEDVIMGCVTKAGEQGFNIGRNAVLASTLPETVPAVTVDRQCGSSQQALHFAAQAVMSGAQDVVIAAGVESMTRVPMFADMTVLASAGIGEGPVSPRIRERFGVSEFSQFTGAEMIAAKHGFDRETLDRFALESHRRAAAATESGAFERELVPVATAQGLHAHDEGIRFDASLDAIGGVEPLIGGGVVTAANASQICDGASGVLVVGERALRTHGLTPLARVVDMTVTAGDPVIMLEEPINTTRRVLDKAGMTLGQIDLFEVNEAFAPIPLAWLKELGADPAKTNVNGGAIALGHPLGASGTKLVATLIHALRARGQRYGLVAMCEGGGTSNATVLEVL
ncbi:acetyl-CoA C-acetyltransferase [Sinisalibacter aestuarii]|uniref:Acetyl-CoA acetyltransferase n=1 Tax=Sinisalibacter aestuarii TaxID=2949426 RepID=A0ABQ5LQB9_9RHOB|nr:acetyl-CoA C-acetyltransferase [Sinisalibacter aestuarii]GKY86838.1 acetyl-CoA acetyltransferase [Sinisalibacter aestuarii]